ncbi:hypothetical protein ONZ45_g12410 [Pleurotus djamor]|nr:hypothetical protein ONZ45_g12410 [Pleurotus djamor]
MSPPHACRENGPLTHESWKSLLAGDEVLYITTWDALQIGKNEHHCGICEVLLDTREVYDVQPRVTFFLQLRPDNFMRARLSIVKGEITSKYYTLYTAEDDPSADDITGRPPQSKLGLEDACRLSLERIKDCLSNHDEICPKPKPVPLPTRVINCSDPTRPHLAVTSGIVSSYLALSYVWGPQTAHLTLKSNIDKYFSHIEPTLIPQTIRDVIHFTHGLGQKYLWVDAFCIIQDSAEDKDNELVRMGQIYRDAYLTLVASRSAHSEAGIPFQFLVPEYYGRHPKFTVPYEDGRTATISIHTENIGSSEQAQPEPVDGRGWCFQESFLSPRKLVFTSRFLEYQCQHHVIPVNNAIKLGFTAPHTSAFKLPADSDVTDVSTWTSQDWETLEEDWINAVSSYTHRALSWPSDKLVAFAGVAERFHQLWGERSGRYIAGLWETSLVSGLLWYRSAWRKDMMDSLDMGDAWAEDPLRPRVEEYIAPSWSWASVQGHVQVKRPTTRLTTRLSVCEVLQCDFSLRDPRQSYGQVTSGKLKLQAMLMMTGPVFLCRCLEETTVDLYKPTEELRRLMESLSDSEECVIVTTKAEPLPVYDDDDGLVDDDIILDEAPTQEEPISVRRDDALALSHIIIPVDRHDINPTLLKHLGHLKVAFDTTEVIPPAKQSYIILRDNGKDTFWEGMIVTQTEEEGGGSYRRVGYWSLSVSWRDYTVASPRLDSSSLEKITLDLV